MSTHINELLQIVIQIRQVLPALLVIGNKLLLPLQQLLALLLQCLTLGALVLNPRNHQVILVGVGELGVLIEELFEGCERKLLILVTIASQSVSQPRLLLLLQTRRQTHS